MIVYDIVQIVSPGALTSTRAGRWLVEHHDKEQPARERAARFNQCVSVAGIRYEVEPVDEESPERADYERNCGRGD